MINNPDNQAGQVLKMLFKWLQDAGFRNHKSDV